MFGNEKRKLREARNSALLLIRGERVEFQTMMQRAQAAGETPNTEFANAVLARIAEIEARIPNETDSEEIDGLAEDAEKQGHLRAYVCPSVEVLDEGLLAISMMEEWSVPAAIISNLRSSLVPKLQMASANLHEARGALRAVLQERDSWDHYTNEYEETMHEIVTRLFYACTILVLLAAVSLHFSLYFAPIFVVAFLFAGAAGSCVSVMAKMPVLEVTRSGELASYGRRIFSRIGVGMVASLIACALLGWGLLPISIHNLTFADMLSSCIPSSSTSCTGLSTLILLGVPMLFGFSERVLTSLEERIFAK
jgi:hypothetical protein